MSYSNYKQYNQYLTCCKPPPGPQGRDGPQGPRGLAGRDGAKYLSFNTEPLSIDFSNSIINDGSMCLFVEKELSYTPTGGNVVIIIDHIKSENKFHATVESYIPTTGYICLNG